MACFGSLWIFCRLVLIIDRFQQKLGWFHRMCYLCHLSHSTTSPGAHTHAEKTVLLANTYISDGQFIHIPLSRWNQTYHSLSNISKPTTVSEHFLTTVMITLPKTPNFIPLEFNRDSVGKARDAYLIETRDDSRTIQVSIRNMKCNTFLISAICNHLFILFLHFKFLSYHYFNSFCFHILFLFKFFTCYSV